jgi:peptidoglycan/xylan/chitin deacetylase (PgdA/CDA1 family)
VDELTVALSFDVDGPSSWISEGSNSKRDVSRGEFAAVGVRRLLVLLDDFAARASFYVPGHTALLFPPLIESLAERGHEVGHHGARPQRPA